MFRLHGIKYLAGFQPAFVRHLRQVPKDVPTAGARNQNSFPDIDQIRWETRRSEPS
jgi:hypothetical protein